MCRVFPLFGIVIVFLVVTTCAIAHLPNELAREKYPPWLKRSDPRLDAAVSVSAPRAQVGELFEALVRETAVRVTPESGAGQTGDFEVTVYFTDCSLWKFMEAVRSLFSMRGSEWSWRQVTGPDGQYCYNLGRTINGSGLDSAIRDEIQRDFEEGLENQIAWIDADETDRRQLEARYPDLVKLMTGGNIPGGIGILKNHTSLEKRTSILRGNSDLRLPFSQLSQDEQAWAQEIWNSTFDQEFRSVNPHPSELYIHTFSQNTVAPALIIALDKTGGYGFAGGYPLSERWRKRIESMWATHPAGFETELGDLAIEGKANEPPVVGSPQSPEYLRSLRARGPNRLCDRMGDMATGARLNVIGEYRISDINVSLPSPFGMKVKDYLASLKSHLYYMAKSENGIVHLRDAAWFNNNPERGLVPWTSIRKWREKVKTSDKNIPPIEVLGELFRMNELQVRRLQAEFPESAHAMVKGSVIRFWSYLPQLARRQALGSGYSLRHVKPEVLALLTRADGSSPDGIENGTLRISTSRAEITNARQEGLRIDGTIERPGASRLFTGLFVRARDPAQMSKQRIVVKRSPTLTPAGSQ